MKCPNPKCSGWVKPVDIVKKEDKKYSDIVHKCGTCEYTEFHTFTENKINNKIGIPFEKLYCATPYEVFKDQIDAYFEDEMIDTQSEYWKRPDGIKVAKGFTWSACHGHFETLTVEPMCGNQFEIAVRFPHGEGRWKSFSNCHKYSGYAISSIPYTIIGKDTGGH